MKPLFAALALTLTLAACGAGTAPHSDADGHGTASATADYERGPHRGRLLREGDFALEVTIFETGVPPQYRLYAYQSGQPIAAKDVTATIELSRLDGEVNLFRFAPEGEVLVGDGTVTEPHSFDVVVSAQHAGKSYRWAYDSYEGRTTMAASVAEAAGVRTEQAGPAVIHERVRLLGGVAMDPNRMSAVRSPFEGPVREVRAALGDTVKAGQTLAVVENRDSLRSFAVTAPISGVVLARHTNVGDVAGADPLFEIADLSTLWVELNAFGADSARVMPGQEVSVHATAGELAADTQIEALSPVASSASQSVRVRALLPNPDGQWRPGMAVRAEVDVASREVPLAVQRIGLQRFRDFTVVFAQVGETYEVRMLELGESDDTHVEVLGGIKPGTPYVTEQSFLIKADVEKSGASHDH